jgi:hypothetical protein
MGLPGAYGDLTCRVGCPEDYRALDCLFFTSTNPLSLFKRRGFDGVSLTMTYFHARECTIIGAVSFHCPVRDGKEWFQDAMVVRL